MADFAVEDNNTLVFIGDSNHRLRETRIPCKRTGFLRVVPEQHHNKAEIIRLYDDVSPELHRLLQHRPGAACKVQ